MIKAQQLGVQPGQTFVRPGQTAVQPGQIAVSPYGQVTGMQDIGTLLTSIMPLIMIIMVFMMLKPMLTGMAEGFK